MASTFFRDFSFGASASQNDHEADRAAMNVSPTSMSHEPVRLPTPPPPCSVGELASRFDQHLHVEVEADPACEWPSAALLLALPTDELAFPSHRHQSQLPRSSRLSSAVLRLQRQSSTRLQCSSSHIKDISKLVERMVEQEEQCLIQDPIKSPTSSPSSASSSSGSDDDEAINMDYSVDRIPLYALNYRRSSDRNPRSTTIARTIRMRKLPRVSKRSSH